MALTQVHKKSDTLPKLHLNSNLFFLLKDGGIILWDYENHQQFSLTSPYFERLLAYARGEISGEIEDEGEAVSDIDQHLLREGILLNQKPQEPRWKWDMLAYIFHIGTRNVIDDPHTSTKAWLADYIDGCEQAVETMPVEQFVKREGAFLPLPAPNLENLNRLPFLDILKERQTIRNFEGQSVSMETLSTLLFVTFGLFHGPWQELSDAGLLEVGIRKQAHQAEVCTPTRRM